MSARWFDVEDMRYLRSELLFRMAVQNLILIMNALVFLGTTILQIVLGRHAASIGLVFILFSGMISAIWCHHGARQAQIKSYLLTLQERQSILESWEDWLPRNRHYGFLGSRWFISTKAIFILGAIVECAAGLIFDHSPFGVSLTIANACGVAVMSWLLLTNPKEGLDGK
ncbi:hypothetical protein [Sphingobium sufflavum]|uniref:hypothetical protein n=1 Tax=Sphingobium sufflavum TaxID=1129547 RepID=UPI001F3574DF|nr:hypothetical protein [Sphingobium sufflavum]